MLPTALGKTPICACWLGRRREPIQVRGERISRQEHFGLNHRCGCRVVRLVSQRPGARVRGERMGVLVIALLVGACGGPPCRCRCSTPAAPVGLVVIRTHGVGAYDPELASIVVDGAPHRVRGLEFLHGEDPGNYDALLRAGARAQKRFMGLTAYALTPLREVECADNWRGPSGVPGPPHREIACGPFLRSSAHRVAFELNRTFVDLAIEEDGPERTLQAGSFRITVRPAQWPNLAEIEVE